MWGFLLTTAGSLAVDYGLSWFKNRGTSNVANASRQAVDKLGDLGRPSSSIMGQFNNAPGPFAQSKFTSGGRSYSMNNMNPTDKYVSYNAKTPIGKSITKNSVGFLKRIGKSKALLATLAIQGGIALVDALKKDPVKVSELPNIVHKNTTKNFADAYGYNKAIKKETGLSETEKLRRNVTATLNRLLKRTELSNKDVVNTMDKIESMYHIAADNSRQGLLAMLITGSPAAWQNSQQDLNRWKMMSHQIRSSANVIFNENSSQKEKQNARDEISLVKDSMLSTAQRDQNFMNIIKTAGNYLAMDTRMMMNQAKALATNQKRLGSRAKQRNAAEIGHYLSTIEWLTKNDPDFPVESRMNELNKSLRSGLIDSGSGMSGISIKDLFNSQSSQIQNDKNIK